MELSPIYSTDTWIIALLQFTFMMLCVLLGRRVAKARGEEQSDNPGSNAMANSLYGLLGLLLAFTFGMSGERFATRRHVIRDEANAIGTAVLRLQLYADSVQPLFRQNFKDYLETRIRYYEAEDMTTLKATMDEGGQIADRIWTIATSQSRISANLVASNQMIPALNDMFDIATTRKWGEVNRTPTSIMIMLFLLAMATSFVAGYSSVGKGKFDWLMAVGFCFLLSMVIFFIIDLDKPRRGIITLDQQEEAIVELRKMFEVK